MCIIKNFVYQNRTITCLQELGAKVPLNLNEDADDQDLFVRVERTRRWRGTVVHIVRLSLL